MSVNKFLDNLAEAHAIDSTSMAIVKRLLGEALCNSKLSFGTSAGDEFQITAVVRDTELDDDGCETITVTLEI